MAEKTLKLNITGMTCEHCVEAVLRALNSVPGVTSADVSLTDNNAVVAFDDAKANAEDFTGAIDEAGYGASVA